MGLTITSCWICGKRLRTEGFKQGELGGPTTTWEVCPDCAPHVYKTAGESRVLVEEVEWDRASRMKKLYVCAPLAGNIAANTAQAGNVAMKLAREAVDRGEDMPLVFVPHLAFQYTVHGEEETYREWAMRMCVAMVGWMDEVVVCGGTVTEGMAMEIEEAKRLYVTVTEREDLWWTS